MDSFSSYILTAFALVFVIEGLIYAIFPEAMQRMIRMALEMTPDQLRTFGFFMALAGATFIWFIQYL
ncbi:MAG: DUF2065 domain-containing protein [Alphaproteobacteria bacterium]|nr:DUF2065 domain-containing protein [Alphaproteobacteria bacterium]